jgi:hypothetical protein
VEPVHLVVAGALVVAVAAWLVDRRRRLYADLPTSPAAAVFAGRNEVKGRAWAEAALRSHRAGAPAVWWDYCLEEEREHTRTVTSTDSNGRTQTRTERYRQWHQIDHRSEALPTFEVVDETGSVPVRLERAKVVPRQIHHDVFRRDDGGGFLAKMFDNRTGRYRETEQAVVVGDDLFVCGDAELDDATCVPVLAGKVLVSTRSEESHQSWLTAGVAVLVLLAVAASVAGSALLLDPQEPTRPTAWLPGLALGVVVVVLAWAVTLYNRLRLVAEGVDRAWSLIDVQLQRRHDLVPALARVVAAHAAHERGRLEGLATGRWAAGEATESTELTGEAAEQTADLRQILAVAERYPELSADASFQRLQRELADSETRIAASRTFYNDSITLLRDRAHSFPGVLVARRLSLTHRDLISAEGFERTAPPVEHSFA